MRAALRSLLAQSADLEVIGEAADGDEVLAMIPPRKPDVVLLDVQMRRLGGIATTRAIATAYPGHPKVLLTSLHADEHMVAEGLRAGAAGYVFKTRLNQDLISALHAVADGGLFVSRAVQSGACSEDCQPHPPLVISELARRLSPTEATLVSLVGRGCTDDEAARQMEMRLDDLSRLLNRVTRHLSLATRDELARFARTDARV